MNRGSSTLLTRLALALLAVLGFVAPLALREVARVEQTAGARRGPVAPREVSMAALEPAVVAAVSNHHPIAEPAGREERAARRYLLNRAWLV